MDNQLFELLVDRFDRQDKVLMEIKDTIKEHVEKDEKYWKKIDVQEGQIKLLKGMGTGFIAVLGYLEWWLFKR